jgi:glycogen phosphorylase
MCCVSFTATRIRRIVRLTLVLRSRLIVRTLTAILGKRIVASAYRRWRPLRHEIGVDGSQSGHAAIWDPSRWTRRLDAKVALHIEDRSMWIGAWLQVVTSHMGGRAPVILLDTDLSENEPPDREITHYLYGVDDGYRLKQEMVLGMGGVRVPHALGFVLSATI